MAAQADPYVRVYYRIIDDPKFRDVYDDDSRLACWMRLLLVADGTWPAPAPIPVNVKRSAFQHLVDVGLVDLFPGSRYRIHGMDAERGERRDKAAAAARIMHSKRSANAVHEQSTSSATAEQRAEQQSMHSAPLRSEPLQPDIPPNPRKRGLRSNGTSPRQVAAQVSAGRKAALDALHLAYQRHEITEDEWKARAAAVRGTPH
jgi:hypothetical protein